MQRFRKKELDVCVALSKENHLGNKPLTVKSLRSWGPIFFLVVSSQIRLVARFRACCLRLNRCCRRRRGGQGTGHVEAKPLPVKLTVCPCFQIPKSLKWVNTCKYHKYHGGTIFIMASWSFAHPSGILGHLAWSQFR